MPEPLFCPIRKIWVADLPEERVRQKLIQEMIFSLGYPIGSLALEKALHQLPHLQNTPSLPKRRTDMIVFAKDTHPHHPFYPLLLIECKAISLTQQVLRQIIGYNQFVDAYFIGVVNQKQSLFGYYHPSYKDFIFQEGIPSYETLFKMNRTF